MSVNIGTAVAYLELDASAFNSGLANVQSSLSQYQTGFSSAMTGIGSALTTTGTALTTGLTIPIANAAKEIVTFGADFEKQMSAVKAVMADASIGNNFERLRQAAIDWGEKTVYTATEAGEALYYMGLAGWDAEQAINGLGSVLNLAAAGQMDLGRASDVVTDSMTAMNLKAGEYTNGIENTAYYTSVLAAVMANANTDVDKLGESFKYVAPTAGQLGYTIEDLGLALGLAANAGVKSSQAGTSLRQALKNLISPTEKTQAAMDAYGISLYDATGTAIPFRQIMLQLQKTFGDLSVDVVDSNGVMKEGEQIMEEYGNSLPLTQQEKLKAVVDLFGTRAMPTMLAIIGQAGTEFNKLADAIDEAARTGTYASTMAETQLDNLSGDWTKFTSALGTTKIILQGLVNDTLRKFVQTLTELVRKFNALDSEQQKQVIKWGLIAAAIGPVMTIFGRLMVTIGQLIPIFSKLFLWLTNVKESIVLFKAGWTALAGEASSFGSAIAQVGTKLNWIVAIIALVITAIVDLWKNSEDFRNKIKAILEQIWGFFKQLWDSIKPLFTELGKLWLELARAIEPVIELIVDLLGPALDGLISFIVPLIQLIVQILVVLTRLVTYAVDYLAPILRVIIELIGYTLKVTNEIISVILQMAGDVIGKLVEALQRLTEKWEEHADTVSALWNTFWTVLSDYISEAGDWLVEFIQTVTDNLLNYYTEYWNEFLNNTEEWWNRVVESLKQFIVNVQTRIAEAGQWFYDWFTEQAIRNYQGWQNHFEAVRNLWDKFITTIKNGLTQFGNWIVEKVNKFIADRQRDFQAFMQFLESLLKSIEEKARQIITVIQQTAEQAWNNIVEGFRRAKDAIEQGITVIRQKFEELRELIRQKFEEIMQHITEAIRIFREKLEELAQAIRQKFEEVIENIRQKVEEIKERLEHLAQVLREKFEEIVQKIKENFERIFEKIREFGLKFVEAWKNAFANVANGIASVFNTIKEGFVKFGTYVFGVAKNVGNAFIKGLLGTGRSIKEFFTNFIRTAIETLLEKINVFKETGKLIIQNLWEGIKSAWQTMIDWIKKAWEELTNGTLFKTIGDWFSNIFDKIGSRLTTGVNGSHADGLAYVPFNGYIAELHKGERVLTAEENEKYTNGSNGTTINFYSPEKIDEYTAARELRRTMHDMELGLV